ncbi:MurR/RpiR family transcriptional regulator [Pseudoramibacter sp.]|jgi:DNA-binding MurR/RpiR family transcriptional regulator|uniref:MurR/RpiR family transcriptional regulator n=1 Tax=Pseudoramibacter sp. TaxID=2034862 RepID=UPI0025FBED5B|nr:MurR/RpiR family transcriptional regulator [Pseudoramibacter sp.]MCH4071593.1 MurR/RpiR family transcriptional regulator [Pseudoramibacter sp.]MCH4105361.1 MurR/RpiR family transcriptional regulator [Pseudoramibacter sp.]
MDEILTNIRTKYNTLSKTQKVIADFILKNASRIPMLSITELAKACDTSETTVMRFLKKLNYHSYQVFRVKIAQATTEEPSTSINDDLDPNDDLDTIKHKIIGHTLTAINDINAVIPSSILKKAIDLIRSSKRIMIYGVGASGAIAMDAYHKFAGIGLDVRYYPDPHLMNITCTQANANDLMLAISHTGESIEVNHAVQTAKENGAKILSLTSFANSTLAKLSDLYLLSSTNDSKYHSEAMASRIVQLTIVDILYTATFMQDEKHYYKALNASRVAVSRNKT